MSKPTLAVMAAGIGSRYGGLKQIDPIGPHGEIIIDYSIHDALKAGFGRVVFIIKEDIEAPFREKVGGNIEQRVDTTYVYQKIDDLPEGFAVPPDRQKPWGTAHAVLSCGDAIDTPFAVINADDFYGPSSFQILADYLKTAKHDDGVHNYAMVGFVLENTLTEYGFVARGVCQVNDEGILVGIKERTRIERFGAAVRYTEDGAIWREIPARSTVSMNMWGFTPSLFHELETRFPRFLQRNSANLQKAEYFLPDIIGELIEEKKARVKVLSTDERWFGVTYQQDTTLVKQAINDLVHRGIYPADLWSAANEA